MQLFSISIQLGIMKIHTLGFDYMLFCMTQCMNAFASWIMSIMFYALSQLYF